MFGLTGSISKNLSGVSNIALMHLASKPYCVCWDFWELIRPEKPFFLIYCSGAAQHYEFVC